ncbi:MAG TPA: HNH endonuclease, partial [Actinomycetota bacterium]|nr:HNH endonuclease [Actinomycetota bacterium]
GGGPLHPETARRLLCDGRVQTVVEDRDGEPLRLGRLSREPSPAMLRLLRYRDVGCTFPGCGARRFTQAHHIVWWGEGGSTDLNNLTLVCFFHHRLVHEHGWRVRKDAKGRLRWITPDGVVHRPGPRAVTSPPSHPRRLVPAVARGPT